MSTASPRTITAPGPSSVVWDAGNGAAGPAMEALAARLPGRHRCLFAEVDGRFPNHHPDPTEPQNLEDLIREVDERRLRARHRLRRRRRPDRRGRRRRAGSCGATRSCRSWRPTCWRAIPVPRSSPTSRPARRFFDEIARLGGVPADVEDRPLADQGQDGRGRLAAVRRDVRATSSTRTASTAMTTRSTSRCACSTSWPAASGP